MLAASEMPFFPEEIRRLHAQGIRAILTLTEDALTSFPGFTPGLFAEMDVSLFHVPVPDHCAPTTAKAREILECIHRAEQEKRPLLIHCMMGIGRTGTALHLYYLEQGLSLADARERVCERRKVCERLSSSQWAFLERWADSRVSLPETQL